METQWAILTFGEPCSRRTRAREHLVVFLVSVLFFFVRPTFCSERASGGVETNRSFFTTRQKTTTTTNGKEEKLQRRRNWQSQMRRRVERAKLVPAERPAESSASVCECVDSRQTAAPAAPDEIRIG